MPADGSSTDLPRPVFSRLYARGSERLEAEGLGALRAELLAGLGGEVLEVGCGNGLNLGHYPSGVTRVLALEPEPRLRALATENARRATVPVEVVAGQAASLPVPSQSVDAVVLCLVLCSVRERSAALTEVRRVLRPGGEVRFLEHTVASTPGWRTVQRVLDATVWPLLVGGCRTATDPLADLAAAGFTVRQHRALRFPDGPTVPTTPHVLGVATAS